MKTKIQPCLVFGLVTIFITTQLLAAQKYRVENATFRDITEHGLCRRVTNNSGYPLMVPTNSAAGWASFYNSSHTGVTIGACPDCPNAGDTCASGIVYAGSGLYTTAANGGQYMFYGALNYCDALVSNGYSDWYLPRRTDLNILTANQTTGSLNGTLPSNAMYWSSTTRHDDFGDGVTWDHWCHNMPDAGGTHCYDMEPSYMFHARCVRR